MNNEWLIKRLISISFSSQEQMKRIELLVTKYEYSEKDREILSVMQQTSHDLDMLTQLMTKAVSSMGELHVSEKL